MQLKPIRFITYVGTQVPPRWKVEQEAIDYLSTIEQPLAIISIAGLYRTGKSFILNQFAGNMTGFDIGSTVQPCTEGIWLWEVNQRSIPEANQNWRYILLDTEGLGSYVRTETYDIQLFCLSLLLGSYFIYNSLNCIDEGAIDKLSFVVELTKHIRVQSEGDMDPNHLKLYFPAFLWLVRDFTLQLVMNGEPITPREYLNRSLEPLKGDPDRIGSKNKVREFIRTYFSDRDCFCLKRPLMEEEKLQNLSALTFDQLRPEYMQQVGQLKSLVFTHVIPKKMNNTDITGPMLVEMAKTYTEAINKGTVPTISSAWENIIFQEAHKALALATNLYTTRMEEGLKNIVEQADFDKLHDKSLTSALTIFREKAIGGAYLTYEPQFQKTIKSSAAKYLEQNFTKSRADCEQLLRTLATNIDDSIFGENVTNQPQLADEWSKKIFAYRQVARGPAKIEVLCDFLENKIFDSVKKVSNVEAKQFKREKEELLKQQQSRHDSEYQRLHSLYVELDNLRLKSEEKISSLQKEVELGQMALLNWEEEKKELINISMELRKRLDPEFTPPPDYASKKEILMNDKNNCCVM